MSAMLTDVYNAACPLCWQVTAGCVLLLGATALGTTAYLFTDLRQRRTYLETRKVIEVKTSIEEQSRTRVRSFELSGTGRY